MLTSSGRLLHPHEVNVGKETNIASECNQKFFSKFASQGRLNIFIRGLTVGGKDKEVLDAILLQEGLLLATLSMNKGKCGYVGYIFGWFWALRVDPSITDG